MMFRRTCQMTRKRLSKLLKPHQGQLHPRNSGRFARAGPSNFAHHSASASSYLHPPDASPSRSCAAIISLPFPASLGFPVIAEELESGGFYDVGDRCQCFSSHLSHHCAVFSCGQEDITEQAAIIKPYHLGDHIVWSRTGEGRIEISGNAKMVGGRKRMSAAWPHSACTILSWRL
ncbi:hypothetical protein L227DRAFT_373723 [Lentinus tigrinus ALCF2SS1-6]|uniref:Uncharacterized protein n=1 Tax=Lentinus tigrinus ALCF2SS1-6 TaxID=1328759 RepID=A0A5C2RRN7_9APHY|nr:hypothetical protein L227DRAFT_373723 [Lentinus tigrinus ALCF2SS1-6]